MVRSFESVELEILYYNILIFISKYICIYQHNNCYVRNNCFSGNIFKTNIILYCKKRVFIHTRKINCSTFEQNKR